MLREAIEIFRGAEHRTGRLAPHPHLERDILVSIGNVRVAGQQPQDIGRGLEFEIVRLPRKDPHSALVEP